MLKRISILSAIFVIVIGITFGVVSPASASTFLPQPYDPSVTLQANVVRTPTPEVYVVKKGDSLSEIAHKFKLHDWRKLYCKNRKIVGHEPWLIQPKMRLVIKESRTLCKVPVQVVIKAPVATVQPAQVNTLSTTGIQVGFGSFQRCVIMRESGGNPRAVNPYSGAGGLYQFLPSTWTALGFPGLPNQAPVWMQNLAFAKEYAQSGTSAWAPYDGC